MDAVAAEAAYRMARRQLDTGQIALAEYNATIAGLMYQDNHGIWWAISPADGSWLTWNGTTWVPAFSTAVHARSPLLSALPPAEEAHGEPGQPSRQASEKSRWSIRHGKSWQEPVVAGLAAEAGQEPVLQVAAEAEAALPPAVLPENGMQEPADDLPEEPVSAGLVRHGVLIAGFLCAIAAWFAYPYMLGTLAAVAGEYALLSAWRLHASPPLSALAVIILALAAMLVTYFPIGL